MPFIPWTQRFAHVSAEGSFVRSSCAILMKGARSICTSTKNSGVLSMLSGPRSRMVQAGLCLPMFRKPIGHWEEVTQAILWDVIGDLEVVEVAYCSERRRRGPTRVTDRESRSRSSALAVRG